MKKIVDISKSLIAFLGGIVGFIFFIKAMIRQEDEGIEEIKDETEDIKSKNKIILDEISDNEDTLEYLDAEIEDIKEEIEDTEKEDPEDTELKDFFNKRGF